jgi:hypothetical protein
MNAEAPNARLVFRPLPAWTDPETTSRRSSTTFRSTWAKTKNLLRKEADYLGASEVVVQVVVTENDLTQSGTLRARTRVRHPGVVVSMNTRHGSLRYATDTYENPFGGSSSWEANAHAIALALVALRAVDRYGVTSRGEQYTGWKALPGPVSPEESAARVVGEMAGWDAPPDPANQTVLRKAWLAAIRIHHPDVGGSHEDFIRLTEAGRVLGITS